MSRNNRLASPKVVEEVNRLIGRFAQIAGVYPQCGRTDDSLFVSGFVGKQRMTMWIAWSDTTVHLLAAERPDQ